MAAEWRQICEYVGKDAVKEVDDTQNDGRLDLPMIFWIIGSGLVVSTAPGKRFGKIGIVSCSSYL